MSLTFLEGVVNTPKIKKYGKKSNSEQNRFNKYKQRIFQQNSRVFNNLPKAKAWFGPANGKKIGGVKINKKSITECIAEGHKRDFYDIQKRYDSFWEYTILQLAAVWPQFCKNAMTIFSNIFPGFDSEKHLYLLPTYNEEENSPPTQKQCPPTQQIETCFELNINTQAIIPSASTYGIPINVHKEIPIFSQIQESEFEDKKEQLSDIPPPFDSSDFFDPDFDCD